jgi:hypothetical protein
MKKLYAIFIAISLIDMSLHAQPSIEWQKCLGGSNIDYVYSIEQTSDEGYIIGGVTSSNDGDVTGNLGYQNYWVVKLNSSGNLVWQKSLGGLNIESITSIEQTSDGAYIILGNTLSNDGDVSGNHGSEDIWVVKLNNLGNIVWQKCLGGSNNENAYSIEQTSDEGYIIGGVTSSNDGDVSGNHGGSDIWVIKLNDLGNIEWQKCLGGSGEETTTSIKQTSDGGYIISGNTGSYLNDGDVSGFHGGGDAWVVKLNNSGNLVWQKCLGGVDNESPITEFQQTTDGTYIGVITTASNDGDVSGNHGFEDIWVVKLNNLGNIVWQKCLGGSSSESTLWQKGLVIQQTADGGYVINCLTYSNDGDVSGNHGGRDIWVVKLNDLGNIEWQKCLGGSGEETTTSIEQTSDGGYIIDGTTTTNDGDVSGYHGDTDIWVVKLNDSGNIEWQKCLGGSDYELHPYGAPSVQQTTDGGYILIGNTSSNDGDVSGNHGFPDIWVIKLSSESAQLDELSPNSKKTIIYIYDITGRLTKIKPNQLLFYKYSDGSVEKKMVVGN